MSDASDILNPNPLPQLVASAQQVGQQAAATLIQQETQREQMENQKTIEFAQQAMQLRIAQMNSNVEMRRQSMEMAKNELQMKNNLEVQDMRNAGEILTTKAQGEQQRLTEQTKWDLEMKKFQKQRDDMQAGADFAKLAADVSTGDIGYDIQDEQGKTHHIVYGDTTEAKRQVADGFVAANKKTSLPEGVKNNEEIHKGAMASIDARADKLNQAGDSWIKEHGLDVMPVPEGKDIFQRINANTSRKLSTTTAAGRQAYWQEKVETLPLLHNATLQVTGSPDFKWSWADPASAKEEKVSNKAYYDGVEDLALKKKKEFSEFNRTISGSKITQEQIQRWSENFDQNNVPKLAAKAYDDFNTKVLARTGSQDQKQLEAVTATGKVLGDAYGAFEQFRESGGNAAIEKVRNLFKGKAGSYIVSAMAGENPEATTAMQKSLDKDQYATFVAFQSNLVKAGFAVSKSYSGAAASNTELQKAAQVLPSLFEDVGVFDREMKRLWKENVKQPLNAIGRNVRVNFDHTIGDQYFAIAGLGGNKGAMALAGLEVTPQAFERFGLDANGGRKIDSLIDYSNTDILYNRRVVGRTGGGATIVQ